MGQKTMNKKVLRNVIKPSYKDHFLTPFPVDFDPDIVGYILDEGSRGNLELQDDLFNTMEDTWDRLRTNLNKLKHNVVKMDREVIPATSATEEVTEDAAEKAEFIRQMMHDSEISHPESSLNLNDTIYDLLDAVGRGISVLEINWKIENSKYIPTSTTKVPATCLGFENQNANPDGNPEELMLFPDRQKSNPMPFSKYPHKFLIGIYRGKSGHIAETAQLRCLAHHWVGRMLGWEWMAQKTELFGIPIRWATYNPSAPESEIIEIKNMLENMGTSAWGAFPNGTQLDVIQGSTPGVAGGSEPTERIQFLADRACDLIFLGQNLTSESGSSGSYALGSIHRQVELDLYEAYANYVEDVFNHQLIPSILMLNYGNAVNAPHVQLLQENSAADKTMVERDKILFKDMRLPVSMKWLSDRHKVPEPAANEILYNPNDPEDVVLDAPVMGKAACNCNTVTAASESNQDYLNRKALDAYNFLELVKSTDLEQNDLIWSGGDCTVCAPLNGTAYGSDWTTPPPLHHNCNCTISVQAKSK